MPGPPDLIPPSKPGPFKVSIHETLKLAGFEPSPKHWLPRGLSPLIVTWLAPQPIGIIPPGRGYGLKEDWLFGITFHRGLQLYSDPAGLDADLLRAKNRPREHRILDAGAVAGNVRHFNTSSLIDAYTVLLHDSYQPHKHDRDLAALKVELKYRGELQHLETFRIDPFSINPKLPSSAPQIPRIVGLEIEREIGHAYLGRANVRVPTTLTTAGLVVAAAVRSPVVPDLTPIQTATVVGLGIAWGVNVLPVPPRPPRETTLIPPPAASSSGPRALAPVTTNTPSPATGRKLVTDPSVKPNARLHPLLP